MNPEVNDEMKVFAAIGLILGMTKLILNWGNKTMLEMIKETVISVSMSIITGCFMKGMGYNDYLVYSVIGAVSLYSPIIFNGIQENLIKFFKNPSGFIDMITKNKNDK